MPNVGIRLAGSCRLAALVLLVAIVLSPLCAMAATTVFFNVVNQGGVIRFLDGQVGSAANLGAGYDSFWLLRTN